MSKQKQITKKQLAVIDDLFESDLNETAILQKHNISRRLYNRWLADGYFVREFDNRISVANKRNAACIATNAAKAIKTLIEMANDTNKGDLTRKACLDIIELQIQASDKQQPVKPESSPAANTTCLSDEAAGRILAALAEEK